MDSKMERRAFLKDTAVAAAGISILPAATVFGTAANSTLNMGVIGCGGRGTNVATSFVANTETRLAAAADLFRDRLTKAQENFNKANAAKGRAALAESNLFVGSQGYRRLLDSKDVDVVLISSPPFLHPEHLEATVQAGKHVYCEKPVGVDVAGCKRVIAAGKKAGNKITLAVGFQIRHASPYVAMVKKIHEGGIGDIVTAQACYLAGTVRLPNFPNATPEELRLRQWLNYRVLSGDILVEQGIHVVDIVNWTMKGHPVKAFGSNGRAGRQDQGDSSAYFVVNYTYPNNVNVSFQSTQFDPGLGDVFERFFGTKGIAEAHYTGGVFIKGPTPWDSGVARGSQEEISAKDWATGAFKSSLEDADPNKQKAVVDSIKNSQYINEAETGAESALSAILGRTAAYTGKVITWDELLASNETWDPKVNLKQFDS
ncbi:MAG: gfo/Idh/MocA family oxidoreductase [Acidobacteria bacterium]|nr:MAG: gfo/Idh/MocA family oxidoreductase [Acidobacteriota bacterium]